jgi:hypothetical protein
MKSLIKAFQSVWQAVPGMDQLLAVASSHTVSISAMTGFMSLTTSHLGKSGGTDSIPSKDVICVNLQECKLVALNN